MRPRGPQGAGGQGSGCSLRRPGPASGAAEGQLLGRARDRLPGVAASARGGGGRFPGLRPARPGARVGGGVGGSRAATRAQPARLGSEPPAAESARPQTAPAARARTLRAGGSRTSRVGTHSSRSPASPAAASSSGGSSDSTFPAMGGRAGGRGVVQGQGARGARGRGRAGRRPGRGANGLGRRLATPAGPRARPPPAPARPPPAPAGGRRWEKLRLEHPRGASQRPPSSFRAAGSQRLVPSAGPPGPLGLATRVCLWAPAESPPPRWDRERSQPSLGESVGSWPEGLAPKGGLGCFPGGLVQRVRPLEWPALPWPSPERSPPQQQEVHGPPTSPCPTLRAEKSLGRWC